MSNQHGRVEKVEQATRITLCCEVEPDIGLATSTCPECGQLDPETMKRVTVERRVVD